MDEAEMERGLGTWDPCVEWEVPTSKFLTAEIAGMEAR
jgi:hypothetical protein